jgi:TonB-linked SusC/RagA family outer membrane protein
MTGVSFAIRITKITLMTNCLQRATGGRRLGSVVNLLFKPILFIFLFIAVNSYGQQKPITGTVINRETNQPMSGVSVRVQGTNNGTQTDNSGSFRINAAPGNILVFSYIGFLDYQQTVDNQSTYSVQLQSGAASNLGEVVVIGYGTQRRKDVTGSIAKVSGDKITSLPTPSFEAGLQGRASGVQVIQGSGLAGSGSVIRIRGIGSISAGADPLYVIDGFPIVTDNFVRGNAGAMNQNPLASINPNDIESIEVLKDAAAAGIYGSRGANGVILITTKKGKAGKPAFNYNNKFGISTYANRPDFLDNKEWLQLRQEAWVNDGNTGLAPLPGGVSWADAMNTNTDWWDRLTRTGSIMEHNLSATFGARWIKNYVGISYSDNESYLKNNSYTRYGASWNAEINPIKRVKLGLKQSFYHGTNKRVPAAWAGGLGDAMSTALPIYPVYNADGSWFTGGSNPFRRLMETQWRNIDDRYIAGANLDIQLMNNLVLRGTGNYETFKGKDEQWESANWQNRTDIPLGQSRSSKLGGYNWMTNVTLNYNLNVGSAHKFTFVAGAEWQERVNKDYGYVQRDNVDKFWNNRDVYNDVYDSTKAAVEKAGGLFIRETYKETFTSYFARVNYVLMDRYSFQLSNRVDGSSKFGPNNKYGWFPTVSFAWTMTDERFIKNTGWFNNLKLRASYGINGNAGVGSSQYTRTYSPGGNFNGNTTLYQNNIGFPDLKWETLKSFDLGLDFAVANNRLTGEIGYFNKISSDILLSAGVSPSTGFTDQVRNIENSKILNEGFELSLNYKIIDKRDLKLSIGGNAMRLYNELKSLGALSPDAAGGGTNDTRVAVGYPIGTNYVVRYYGVDPNDGLPIWYDKTGKLTKTFSLDNRVPVGSVNPEFVGGLNHNLTYKNFEFSSLWTYTVGGNIYDGSGKRQAGIVTDWNMRRDVLDRWTKPGDVTQFPRLTMNTNTYAGLSSEWQYNSTLFLYDASYMRLRELTFAYRFTPQLSRRFGMKGIRFYVTGMNLLTFTKYPGGDPEIARDFENPQDRNLSPNITYLTPPQAKSAIIGFNLNF